MSKQTRDLVRLIERHAGDENSYADARRLIAQGADIRVMTKNGYMIDSVVAEEKRHALARSIKASYCRNLISLLQNRASDLLRDSVLSSNTGNLNDIELLIRLGGTCNQEYYGSLGLLGAIIRQDKIPIHSDVVKLLIDKDPYAKSCLTKLDEQQQTCLSLAKNNRNCSQEVINCIQNEINMILNQIPFSNSPIHINEIIEWIRLGANTEATDQRGNTVLTNAVLTNNLELVRALIDAGCDTSSKNHDKLTPLDIATNAVPRNGLLVALLTQQNINIKLKQLIEKKKSKLTVDEVHTVLEQGANINAILPNKNTLLHFLISNEGTPEMISAFVNEFNADISAVNIDGYRPIEKCILLDKAPFSILSTMLTLPKMVTSTFFNVTLNKSILQFANEQKRTEAARIIQDELNDRLWNCISRANTDETRNQSILAEATKLIEYGAIVDHKHSEDDYNEWTVLHLACKLTTRKMVEYIIENLRASYTLRTINGDYPISIAAEHGQLPIVQYLRGLQGIQLNVSNRNKETPLHLATKNYHLLVVRYLILWGADHQAQNSAGQTPLDIAETNVHKTEDLTIDNELTEFLERLICPIDESKNQDGYPPITPNPHLDTCELVEPIFIDTIQISDSNDYDPLAATKKNFFNDSPNEKLLDAAKNGDLAAMNKALGEGADIRCRKHNRTAYEIAKISIDQYRQKLTTNITDDQTRQRNQSRMNGCQKIMEELSRIAQEKLIESIKQSHSGRFLAYHLAGAPLTPDLVNLVCSSSDSVQIMDYLIQQGIEFFKVLFNYKTKESPYHIAKKQNSHKIANYLKYILSKECTEAIKNNNFDFVKLLVRAGASVDIIGTNNLNQALQHQNIEMIGFLCENGIKMPEEWLRSKTIGLPNDVYTQMDPKIAFCINRCLINRRLRWAAASGNLQTVIQCQRLAADINSKNCHGSTALLCTIQHGNYFRIVHALVSCGATILHSNPNEPISLIELAKKKNYKQIEVYLFKELNTQFMSTMLDNDTENAIKFEGLGADFNCQDEKKRTPLHYAIQYHGIDLVQWLCKRGSNPTLADINGDYPLTLAVKKGTYNTGRILMSIKLYSR